MRNTSTFKHYERGRNWRSADKSESAMHGLITRRRLFPAYEDISELLTNRVHTYFPLWTPKCPNEKKKWEK